MSCRKCKTVAKRSTNSYLDYYLMPPTFLQFTIVSSKTKHSGSFYRCDHGAILTIHVDVNGGGERDGPIVIRCVAG